MVQILYLVYMKVEHETCISKQLTGIGGLKVWECTNDLVEYISNGNALGINSHTCVLEVGCGHGLPGIHALRLGATVHFQDYVGIANNT